MKSASCSVSGFVLVLCFWVHIELGILVLVIFGISIYVYNNNNNLLCLWDKELSLPSDLTAKVYGGIHTLPLLNLNL